MAGPHHGIGAKNAKRLVPAGGDRPDAERRVRTDGRRSSASAGRGSGFRPDAPRCVRPDAPRYVWPHSPGRVRPDATGRDWPDAPGRSWPGFPGRDGADPAFCHRSDADRRRAAAPAAFRSALRPDAPPRHRSAGLADVRSRLWPVPARRDGSAPGGRNRPPTGSLARIRAEAGRQVSARPGPALSTANAGRSRDGSDTADRVRPGGSAGREPPAASRRRMAEPEAAAGPRAAG